jgi:hypothetical protein
MARIRFGIVGAGHVADTCMFPARPYPGEDRDRPRLRHRARPRRAVHENPGRATVTPRRAFLAALDGFDDDMAVNLTNRAPRLAESPLVPLPPDARAFAARVREAAG